MCAGGCCIVAWLFFFFSSRRRHTRCLSDWSSDVCSSDLCGCSCFSFFLRSLRWRILLNAEERLSVGTVFSANMAGYLGNSFLPARAGELVRTIAISTRSSLSKTYVLTTALSERLMDAIALVLWSSLILLGDGAKPRWIVDLSRTTAVAAAAGALALALLPHMEGLWRSRLPRFAEQGL